MLKNIKILHQLKKHLHTRKEIYINGKLFMQPKSKLYTQKVIYTISKFQKCNQIDNFP